MARTRLPGLNSPAALFALGGMARVPRDKWNVTPVSEAMRPLERLHQIEADAPVTQALDVIGREDVNQLPVLDHGRLRGVVSRDQVLRVLTARAEMSM